MSPPTRRPTGAPRGPIWLVRHAPTEWTGRRWCGRSDPELSVAGRTAAQRLAVQIATDLGVDQPSGAVVLSSPLRRALDTARAIARALDAPVHVEPDLVEVDFGSADGLTWDELAAAHPSIANATLAGRNPDWPGGETAANVSARARSALDRILERAETTAVVVVSHGGLLGAITHLVGVDVSPGPFEPASAVRFDPGRIG